jgi:hypothetical protein
MIETVLLKEFSDVRNKTELSYLDMLQVTFITKSKLPFPSDCFICFLLDLTCSSRGTKIEVCFFLLDFGTQKLHLVPAASPYFLELLQKLCSEVSQCGVRLLANRSFFEKFLRVSA